MTGCRLVRRAETRSIRSMAAAGNGIQQPQPSSTTMNGGNLFTARCLYPVADAVAPVFTAGLRAGGDLLHGPLPLRRAMEIPVSSTHIVSKIR